VSAYRPLLSPADRAPITRAGALLAAADEMQRRVSPHAAPLTWRLKDGSVRFDVEIDGAPLAALSGRLERALGLKLTASR